MQTRIKLQDFIATNRLDPAFGRKLHQSLQLGFDLNGGVDLAASLDTPEISRSLKEEVLAFSLGKRLKVHLLAPPLCTFWLNLSYNEGI